MLESRALDVNADRAEGRRRSSRSRCDGEPESRAGNGEAGRQTAAKRWWRGDAAAGDAQRAGSRERDEDCGALTQA